MKLFLLETVVTDHDVHFVDDNDPTVFTSAAGVFSAPERAMERASKLLGGFRQTENDLIDEIDDGEAHLPELAATFTEKPAFDTTWMVSDRLELPHQALSVEFIVRPVELDE